MVFGVEAVDLHSWHCIDLSTYLDRKSAKVCMSEFFLAAKLLISMANYLVIDLHMALARKSAATREP